MGVDRTDKSTESDTENNEKLPAEHRTWRPPPDRQGSPGQPSRLEGRGAVAGREPSVEQRDDEEPPTPAQKPKAEAEKTTAEEDLLRDDQPPAAAPVGDAEQKADEDLGDTGDALAADDRSGPERPEEVAEEDTEDESADAGGAGARSEPKSESKKLSGSEVWEEFASKSATYESHGRRFGFRTWGEEFEARRASREAAAQDEPVLRDEAPSADHENAADTGSSTAGGDLVATAEAGDTAPTVGNGTTRLESALDEGEDATETRIYSGGLVKVDKPDG